MHFLNICIACKVNGRLSCEMEAFALGLFDLFFLFIMAWVLTVKAVKLLLLYLTNPIIDPFCTAFQNSTTHLFGMVACGGKQILYKNPISEIAIAGTGQTKAI